MHNHGLCNLVYCTSVYYGADMAQRCTHTHQNIGTIQSFFKYSDMQQTHHFSSICNFWPCINPCAPHRGALLSPSAHSLKSIHNRWGTYVHFENLLNKKRLLKTCTTMASAILCTAHLCTMGQIWNRDAHTPKHRHSQIILQMLWHAANTPLLFHLQLLTRYWPMCLTQWRIAFPCGSQSEHHTH